MKKKFHEVYALIIVILLTTITLFIVYLNIRLVNYQEIDNLEENGISKWDSH
jgi:hypothetical protein